MADMHEVSDPRMAEIAMINHIKNAPMCILFAGQPMKEGLPDAEEDKDEDQELMQLHGENWSWRSYWSNHTGRGFNLASLPLLLHKMAEEIQQKIDEMADGTNPDPEVV